MTTSTGKNRYAILQYYLTVCRAKSFPTVQGSMHYYTVQRHKDDINLILL